MPKRILIINGHPDTREERFCSSIVTAYVESAKKAGHEVRRVDVGSLSFPPLVRFEEFREPINNFDIRKAQEDIVWAEHLVFVHPLWLGMMPAMLKAFLERVACGGFAFDTGTAGKSILGLSGKSARLIVAMAMPALAFRLVFGGYGEKAFARSILRLSGVRPVRKTYFGAIELSERHRRNCLAIVRRLAIAGK